MNWLLSKNRGFALLFAVCACILFGGSVQAQSETVGGPVETNTHGLSPREYLRAKFFQSLQFVFQERYAEAGDEIHALLDQGRDFGYRNFPEFSLIFLKEAEKVRGKNPELAAFFVRQAMALSPSELSVAISAFSFSDLIEKKTLWKHLQETLWPSLKRPTYLLPVLINMVMLILSALTIAAIIGGFVQLLRHGELVFRYITRFIPRNYRGVFGPVAVLLTIALPLLWGPGIAMACWAAILGRSLKHCRWFSFLVGGLLLSWSLVISLALPMKAVLSSRVTQVVDELNTNGMIYDAEGVLRDAVARSPKDPLLALSLAKVLLYEGQFSEGEKILRLADGLAGGTGEVSRVSRLNLAVILIREKHWDEARQILEQDESLGGTRFEVLYNLALVHLAQLDIEEYRTYYTRAQEFDRREWQRLDGEQGQQHLPVWSGVHTMGFLSAFLDIPLEATSKQFPAVAAGQQKISSAFIRGASPQFLGVVGLLLMGLVFVKRSRSGRLWTEQHMGIQASEAVPKDSSLLWSLLPGGGFLAGRRPVIGVLFATVCFSVAFIMTGWPLHFLPISHFPFSIQKIAFTSFVIAYGVGFIIPVLIETLRRPQGAGALHR